MDLPSRDEKTSFEAESHPEDSKQSLLEHQNIRSRESPKKAVRRLFIYLTVGNVLLFVVTCLLWAIMGLKKEAPNYCEKATSFYCMSFSPYTSSTTDRW